MEEVILSKVCVLVTAAFLLTLVPGFRRPDRSLLSVRDRGTALLVFLLLGFLEEAVVRETGGVAFGRTVPTGGHQGGRVEQSAIGRQINCQVRALIDMAV